MESSKNYKYLKAGHEVSPGDEMFLEKSQKWIPAHNSVGFILFKSDEDKRKYRRPIKPQG
jgi:hypothetical protein